MLMLNFFDLSLLHHHHQIFQEIFIVNLSYAEHMPHTVIQRSRNILSAFMGAYTSGGLMNWDWEYIGDVFLLAWGLNLFYSHPIITLQRRLPFFYNQAWWIHLIYCLLPYRILVSTYFSVLEALERIEECGMVGYYLWKER